jgi:glycosyltransferase involved in cell wall biosynthesis
MDFVFLSTQAWDEMDGAGRPTHYLARELLARGERVLYVEFQPSRGEPPRVPTVVNFSELGFDERAHRRAWFNLNPRVEFEKKFLQILAQFETPHAERIAIYADPFIPFVNLFPSFRARGYKIVYEALDDFEAFSELGLYFADVDAEKFLVANADLTIAVSTPLVEKLTRLPHRGEIHLLRQGYDPRAFARAKVRTTASESPPKIQFGVQTLGFWGLVNYFNLDVDLISYVAHQRPTWSINLIGPVDTDPTQPRVGARLSALPNVHLLGRVPHAELRDFLPWFDVMLIPFPDTQFNRARDPLKVFEYLAGYKPVVAAHTPQLAGMPYVYLAASPEEFLEQIERSPQIPVERALMDAYLAASTWAARTDTLSQLLAHTEASPAIEIFQPRYADDALTAEERAALTRLEEELDAQTQLVAQLEEEWRVTQAYLRQLESSHPALWLRRSRRQAPHQVKPSANGSENFSTNSRDCRNHPANVCAYENQLTTLLAQRCAYAAKLQAQRHAVDAYIRKLELTHPTVWFKRLLRQN